jgi:hypothetical protein
MNTSSKQLTETIDRYLVLSERVQQALAELESFYNEPGTQIVLNNVDQASVTPEAFQHFEDSCIWGDYTTYVENMVAS